MAQLFQRFFPITDIATYRLNQSRGQIIWNANKVGRKRWRYHHYLFPACKGLTQDQLSIGRHPHKIFNLKVCLIKPFISGFQPNSIEHRAQTGQPHWSAATIKLWWIRVKEDTRLKREKKRGNYRATKRTQDRVIMLHLVDVYILVKMPRVWN